MFIDGGFGIMSNHIRLESGQCLLMSLPMFISAVGMVIGRTRKQHCF
jgi:hypothetical protein